MLMHSRLNCAMHHVTRSLCGYSHSYLRPPIEFRNGYRSSIQTVNLIHTKSLCKSHTNFETTLANQYEYWTEEFRKIEIGEPELSAKHIIDYVRKTKFSGGTVDALTLDKDVLDWITVLMTCRMQRMPVQYIIKEWDFHSVTLDLRPPVFIPRPETETLVNLAMEVLQPGAAEEKKSVLELCCGSGAISLALLHNLSNVNCVALDQSGSAISLTAHNASKLGLGDRLDLHHAKIDEDLDLGQLVSDFQFDLIVCNPPYVPSMLVPTLQPEILLYEDLRALDGGRDGMDLIKTIIKKAPAILKDDGHLMFEIDPIHAKLLPKYMEESSEAKRSNLRVSRIMDDLAGKQRFIHLVKNHV